MILFFTTEPHRYTLDGLRKSRYRKEKVKVRSYDWLFRQSVVRAGVCVFTDFERLRHFELVMAARVFRQLRLAGVRVLNDPARSCQRRELLFRLHKAGINGFRAYSAALDPTPSRFPVFLKCECDHAQEFRELISDQATLNQRLDALRASGFPLHYMLVIEFANREHRSNVYRRYSIYRIGERMVPANPVTEANPFVKYGTAGLATEADLSASVDVIMHNPHADHMRRVFEIAEIEYGRADFGFDGDAPAIYEINTNPTIGTHVPGAAGEFADAVEHSMRLIAEAVDALNAEDRQVRLSHPGDCFSRRPFSRALLLKQP
jgi:hypothetical protein